MLQRNIQTYKQSSKQTSVKEFISQLKKPTISRFKPEMLEALALLDGAHGSVCIHAQPATVVGLQRPVYDFMVNNSAKSVAGDTMINLILKLSLFYTFLQKNTFVMK